MMNCMHLCSHREGPRRNTALAKQHKGNQKKLIGSGTGCREPGARAQNVDHHHEQVQTMGSAPQSGLRKKAQVSKKQHRLQHKQRRQ
jgi:hypothetical protein